MAAFAGTEGDDFYLGTEEADYIGLFDGDDQAYTYCGSDNIVARDGNNTIDSGSGNDTIVTGSGGDIIRAGDGNDFIVDDGSTLFMTQYFYGGSGDDQFVMRHGGETILYGGSGNDTFQLVRAGDLTEAWLGVPDVDIRESEGAEGGHDTIILATGWSGFVMAANVEDLIADNSNAEEDRITWDNRLDNTVLGVEVTGNASHNYMLGSIVRDILKGETGNDTLDAYFGDGDRLYGGNGDDRLILNFAVNAKLYGGADDDTYVLRNWTTATANSIVEYSNLGEDTIEVRGASIDLNRSNLYAIENVTFSADSAGAARTVTGNALSNVLLTHVGNDTVSGNAGDDEIRTANGIDWLEGGVGNDTLDAGADADRVYGGAGNDSVLAGSGDDWVYGEDGDDYVSAGDGVDFVYGGNGNDQIFGFGGNDFLYGDAGNDTVTGDAGNDAVFGGDGDDKVYGGEGNDRVVGGAGVDLAYGGAGSDRFVFNTLADAPMTGLDRVMDFVKGVDLIDLSGIDANTTLAGNQTFNFLAERPFFTSAGDVWTRDTILGDVVEGDVNGDGNVDFRILVTGGYDLQASSFIL